MFNKKQNYFVVAGVDKKSTLSMSDAQALSNLCYQKATSIGAKLKQVNNYSKILDFSLTAGVDSGLIDSLVKVKPMPIGTMDVKEMLLSQARYYSFQAFLMEHIKLKDSMIKEIKKERDNFQPPAMATLGEEFRLLPSNGYMPKKKDVVVDQLWEEVPKQEILKYLVADANAAHIGMFIHKDSKLDTLRKELPKLPAYEYESLPDNRTALCRIAVHHTPEQLDIIHVTLADTHRDNERIVNAIGASIKDAATKLETKYQGEYGDALAEWTAKSNEINAANQKTQRDYNAYCEKLRTEHVTHWNQELDKVVKSRIQVPQEFESIVDELNVKK